MLTSDKLEYVRKHIHKIFTKINFSRTFLNLLGLSNMTQVGDDQIFRYFYTADDQIFRINNEISHINQLPVLCHYVKTDD